MAKKKRGRQAKKAKKQAKGTKTSKERRAEVKKAKLAVEMLKQKKGAQLQVAAKRILCFPCCRNTSTLCKNLLVLL